MPHAPLLDAMRPHQWVKNLLVFAPLVFAHRLVDPWSVGQAALAFVTFCALASAVYLFNDIVDADADREHSVKRARPIAAGRLSVRTAAVASLVLAAGGVALATAVGPDDRGAVPFVAWPAAYTVLNVAYGLRLKQIAIVDVLCVAVGFQFRVHAGSVAVGVPSSKWLLLCTFFFAMFLAFCKRRQELAHHVTDGDTRRVLKDYSLGFLDQVIAPLAAMSILAYSLYTLDARTMDRHGPYLMLTVPFVVFGVFRYLWLVHHEQGGDDPARLLVKDRQILISGVLWAAVVLAVVLGAAPTRG